MNPVELGFKFTKIAGPVALFALLTLGMLGYSGHYVLNNVGKQLEEIDKKLSDGTTEIALMRARMTEFDNDLKTCHKLYWRGRKDERDRQH